MKFRNWLHLQEYGRSSDEIRDMRTMHGPSADFSMNTDDPLHHRAASGLIAGIGSTFQKSMFGVGGPTPNQIPNFFNSDNQGKNSNSFLASGLVVDNDDSKFTLTKNKITNFILSRPDVKHWMDENGFGNMSFTSSVWGTENIDGKTFAKVIVKFPPGKSIPPDIQEVK